LEALESHCKIFSPRTYDREVLEFLAAGIEQIRQIELSKNSFRRTLFNRFYLPKNSDEVVVPSKAEYLEYFGSHFHPSNVVVAVSGSSRNEQVLSELVELTAELKVVRGPAKGKTPSREADLSKGFSYRHERGDIQKPLILMGYPVPGLGHKDYPAVKLLEYVLGEGNSALLNSSHDDEGANGFLARVSLEKSPVGELFLVSLVSEPQDVDKAEVRALAMMEALSQVDLPPILLDRAKALMLTDYYEALSQLDKRASSLVFAEAAGEVKTRNRIPQILAQISAQDLKSLLGRYFSRERLKIVEYFPAEAEKRTFSQDAFQETLGILVPGEVRNQISVIEV
ncbi:MAG: M16 family metallopeptidase, partial [bacterium]